MVDQSEPGAAHQHVGGLARTSPAGRSDPGGRREALAVLGPGRPSSSVSASASTTRTVPEVVPMATTRAPTAREGLHQGGTGRTRLPPAPRCGPSRPPSAARGRSGDPGGQEGVGQGADRVSRSPASANGCPPRPAEPGRGRQALARVQRQRSRCDPLGQFGAEGGDRLGPALGRRR